ncbi:MAG: hypothetical protein ABIG92_03370 [Candidatus Omnitrophota bacterium]
MSEKLKELLDKINREGIEKGEENARSIEEKAKKEASKLIQDAKLKAKNIIEEAESTAKKTVESGELTLKQAYRDLVLSLKEEIRNILNKVISVEASRSLSKDKLVNIIESLIENFIKEKKRYKRYQGASQKR